MKYLQLLLCFFMAPALAQETPPDALVRGITQEVVAIIKQDKDIQSGNSKKIAELVDAKVLPHFNFQRMTQLARAIHGGALDAILPLAAGREGKIAAVVATLATCAQHREQQQHAQTRDEWVACDKVRHDAAC